MAFRIVFDDHIQASTLRNARVACVGCILYICTVFDDREGIQMVSFSQAALEAFLGDPSDAPFAMLNLIQLDPDGGRERYEEYHERAKPSLVRYGAKIIFGGNGLPVLTEGAMQGWDVVLVVQYPNRAAFKAMVADLDYQEAFRLGASAISDIVLQPMTSIDGLAGAYAL